MKRLVTTSLLVGYVLLVPFCFFGGMLVSSVDTMNMVGNPMHQMNDCLMQLGGCAMGNASGAMDPVAHHVGMYNSITETPLVALLLLSTLIAAFSIIAFWFSQGSLSTLLFDTALRFRLHRGRERARTTHLRILNWLALFEASPNSA